MSEPAPLYIARAVALALTPKTRAAVRYLDEWQGLRAAGVPVEHARAVLDEERKDTKSTDTIEAWNELGVMGLCGDYGPGKTFAAACWILAMIRRGRSAYWVSAAAWAALDLDDQSALARRAGRAHALVIDDIGAGVTAPRKSDGGGSWYQQQIDGILVERGERPTVLASNKDPGEMGEFLSGRVLDRLRACGGLVEIRGASLRRPKPPVEDEHGRSPRWFAAKALIHDMGTRWASVWTPEAGDASHFVAGERLESRTVASYRAALVDKPEADARKHALSECRELARRHKLDGDAILVRARELEANDPATKFDAEVAKAMASESPTARAKRRWADDLEADNARRSEVCYDTLAEQLERLRGEQNATTFATAPAPEWAEGQDGRKRLYGLGYRAFTQRDGSTIIRDKAKKMVIPAHAHAGDAWESLARLWGS